MLVWDWLSPSLIPTLWSNYIINRPKCINICNTMYMLYATLKQSNFRVFIALWMTPLDYYFSPTFFSLADHAIFRL